MKKFFAALLALCVLAFAGCAKHNTPDVVPEEPPRPALEPDTPAVPDPEPIPEPPDEMLVDALGLTIPIPAQYAELLSVETELEAWSEHWTPLASFSETASVEAGQLDHPDTDCGDGWLCTIVRLDRVGFEEWAGEDSTGTRVFARDGEETYYLLSQPTDVRFYRTGGSQDGIEQWQALCAWADGLSAQIIERNGLSAYDASELFAVDYIYPGAHVDLICRFPGEAMDQAILTLSQPVRQGEGGIWCVERVRYVYSEYDWANTQLVFPASFGVGEAAATYYAQMQTACDAGEYPELLTPAGAAVDYARRAATLFGEDVSVTDFEVVESLG